MAGFFGFGNYEKPGKGVRKDEAQKNRFFLFFEIYFRNFWVLVRLNLIWLLACIPVITFGPATASLMRLCSDVVERKKVYVWHDFWKEFKKNFKSCVGWGIFELLMMAVCVYAVIFFTMNFGTGQMWIYFGFAISVVFTIGILFAFFYSWLLAAKIEIGTFAMLKNSVILGIMSVKGNLIVGAYVLGAVIIGVILSPFSWFLFAFLAISTLCFLISYQYFPYVYLYVIKPYYDKTGETDPYAPPVKEDESEYEYEYAYEDENGNLIEVSADETAAPEEEEEEVLFTDAPEIERSSTNPHAAAKGKGKSKTIR